MTNWKRLDPWWYSLDFLGAHVKDSKYGYEGIVAPTSDMFEVNLGGVRVMTTPWHTDNKWWVDIDSLPDTFIAFDSIIDGDPDHPGLYSQDEWSPRREINDKLTEAFYEGWPDAKED